eukprot:tig00020610_g12012.t1
MEEVLQSIGAAALECCSRPCIAEQASPENERPAPRPPPPDEDNEYVVLRTQDDCEFMVSLSVAKMSGTLERMLRRGPSGAQFKEAGAVITLINSVPTASSHADN